MLVITATFSLNMSEILHGIRSAYGLDLRFNISARLESSKGWNAY